MRATGRHFVWVALLCCSCLGTAAHAANFCADTEGEIRVALTASQTNGETNFVRVVSGTYALDAALGYSTSAANSLFITGGYAPGCATRNRLPTVLDGQGSVRPFFLNAVNANIAVEGFEFVDGLSTNNRGGGLSIRGKDVRVDLNKFIANRAENDFGGALHVSSSGEMRIRGNLFLANSASFIGAIEAFSNGTFAAITGNTVVANTSDNPTSPGGVWIGGSAPFTLSNNILWSNNANGAKDLYAGTAHKRIDNDIGTSDGSAPSPASAGNLSVDPDFAPCDGFLCFSFILKRSSPLVDAGENIPDGAPTSVDLLNVPRQIGPRADIGAYELDLLFADGFQ